MKDVWGVHKVDQDVCVLFETCTGYQLILTVKFDIDSITIGYLSGVNKVFIKLGGLDTKVRLKSKRFSPKPWP